MSKKTSLISDEMREIWADRETIHKSYAPDLDAKEFRVFVAQGMALGANPWFREIYGTKIKGKASAIIARDFSRRKGQEQPDYKLHFVEAVYSEDEFVFETTKGMPDHKIKAFADRGTLVGAYILIWKKGIDRPYYLSIRKDEYIRDMFLWKTKPETMLKKVVEAQGFRMAYQGVFKGTYSEDEHQMIKNDSKKELAEPLSGKPPEIENPESLKKIDTPQKEPASITDAEPPDSFQPDGAEEAK